jgi:amino acid adenylation domain-containing protein
MIENIYPLSPLQEGIYYHWLIAPEAPTYFDQLSYVVKGKLNIGQLEQAYGQLLQRHAILRTFFTQDFGDKALQVVVKEVPNNFVYKDCLALADFDAVAFKAEDRAKGFNLQAGSQMRLAVLGLGDDAWEFIWSFHHILMDGWCVGILISEFFQLYHGLAGGVETNLGKVYPYVSYIQWLSKVNQQDSLAYWKDYLAGYDTPCTLPRLQHQLGQPYRLEELRMVLPIDNRQKVQARCAELRITENNFIQTAWGILLSIYNNTRDVVFGTVVSGRPAEIPGIETMVGLFINTVPVRVRTPQDITVSELLKQVHAGAVDGTVHHYTQLAQIQAETGLGHTLLDHVVVFENHPVGELIEQEMQDGSGLTLLGQSSVEQSNYDLNVILLPVEDLTIKFCFNLNEYTVAFIDQVGKHFLAIIQQMASDPGMAVSDIDCLDDTEKKQLTVAFNDTAVDYPVGRSIAAVFEEQAALTPDKLALIDGDTVYTYRQLNELCNQAAHYLRAQHRLRPDDRVAVYMQRGHWQIVAILAILKAGGAYLPIDIDYPQGRVDYMLSDSGCQLTIDDAILGQLLPLLEGFPKENPASVSNAGSLAYIMYTSGSTGRPKGVMVEQGGVVRLVKPLHYMGFTGNEVLLSAGAIGFDATTFEFWSMLLNGGTLVMCDKNVLLDTGLLAKTLQRHRVDTMFFTAGWLNQLVDSDIQLFEGLRTIKVGGDRLSPKHIYTLRQRYPDLTIVNGYGPTENTGASCCYTVQGPLPDIPIGKPIDNSTAWVLDGHLRLVPIGVAGELCVGGDGLARGYLNNPALTAERFIENPFRPGTKIYKTGDLARWLPDGNLAFIGRRDNQVKIRGHRVELGEIEETLRQYPSVEDAVVVAQPNTMGEKELVAYIVSQEPITDVGPLSAYIGSTLPFYMVPAIFVQLPQLPLNAHGKVDRKQLPHPAEGGQGIGIGVEYVAPSSETEEKLVQIWQEVLGRQKIGIKDNFFAIGGHSLKATRVMSNIRKELKVNLPLTFFFANPTIEQVAGEIEKTKWANSELFDIEDAERLSL